MNSENGAFTLQISQLKPDAIILTELVAQRVKPEKSTVFKQQTLNFWNLWPQEAMKAESISKFKKRLDDSGTAGP